MKYTQGWGAITGVVAYDSNYEEVAGKVRLDFNATNDCHFRHGRLRHRRQSLGSDQLRSSNGRGFYKQWGGNWAVWGGGTYKFNEKTSFNLQVSSDEGKNVGVAANVAYDVVPGFTVTAEVDYLTTAIRDATSTHVDQCERRTASAARSASSARSNGQSLSGK